MATDKQNLTVGMKVKLRPDVLVRHSKSVPAHMGYTTQEFAWRETLRKLADKVGTVSMVFPSGSVNVDFDSKTIGIESSELIQVKGGKGWKEAADHTGKAPIHKAVATKKKLSSTARKPMSRQSEAKWVEATLLNDETSTDEELVEHFVSEGISIPAAEFYVSQRNDALKDPLGFKLKPKSKAPKHKYSSLEKAILGVSTDAEVEESHRRREQSAQEDRAKAATQFPVVIEHKQTKDRIYTRMPKGWGDPDKWVEMNYYGRYKFIGALAWEGAGVPDIQRRIVPLNEVETPLETHLRENGISYNIIRMVSTPANAPGNVHGYDYIAKFHRPNGKEFVVNFTDSYANAIKSHVPTVAEVLTLAIPKEEEPKGSLEDFGYQMVDGEYSKEELKNLYEMGKDEWEPFREFFTQDDIDMFYQTLSW